MKYIYTVLMIWMVAGCTPEKQKTSISHNTEPKEYALVIHGGAGAIEKVNVSDEREQQYLAALQEALDIGKKILSTGGSAMDAVEAVIVSMEDFPMFNAGRGSVFTHDKTNEMDASFMDGSTQDAGAVGGVTTVKNPIRAARAVMEKSKHVMMVGRGAERFAATQGLAIVDPSYFHTQKSMDALIRVMKAEESSKASAKYPDKKHGTVGCVALDKNGNIAAGTSTGGMTNKRYNRVGDSPIIGAGTFADKHCGISCTGHGEYFIRYTVAKDIAALHEYGGMSFQDAADTVIMKKLTSAGGAGGMIGLDKLGNIAMTFNTKGMFRGYVTPETSEVKIYND